MPKVEGGGHLELEGDRNQPLELLRPPASRRAPRARGGTFLIHQFEPQFSNF